MLSFFSDLSEPRPWRLRPTTFPKKSKLNCSSKIWLPRYVLQELTIMNAPLPYIFEISHKNKILKTKVTVGDFMDSEDEVIVPKWIYEHLDLKNSKRAIINIAYDVPKGHIIKLVPHHVEFLEVENPKNQLETALREYGVLTQGDEISLTFSGNKTMGFTVKSVSNDEGSVYIVDTDLNVEFEAPIGYEEKLKKERTVLNCCDVVEENGIKKFIQKGLTLFLDFEKLAEL